MKHLYAPWRQSYVTQPKNNNDDKQKCVLCEKLQSNNDKENLVLKRFKSCAVIMNLYPYNTGHLLILPYKHKASLSDLTQETRAELMEVTSLSLEVLKSTLKAHGVNVGINFGNVSGGGLSDHLHIHAIPRWKGDTNFLAITGETKVVSVSIEEVYELLLKAFKE
ncbi:HIT domain-containing protein [Candidatus Babeliales bacterium]|nr:HIT domain-containing protein [Candidatus Babeliales bacterium]